MAPRPYKDNDAALDEDQVCYAQRQKRTTSMQCGEAVALTPGHRPWSSFPSGTTASETNYATGTQNCKRDHLSGKFHADHGAL